MKESFHYGIRVLFDLERKGKTDLQTIDMGVLLTIIRSAYTAYLDWLALLLYNVPRRFVHKPSKR